MNETHDPRQKLRKDLSGRLESLSTVTAPPDEIFHYTTVDGLLGIATSAHLWATDVRYLNDTREFKYTVELAWETLEDVAKFAESPDEMAVVRRLEHALTVAEVVSVYVISFSEHRDQLSQWRAYGRSGGVAIGLLTKDLKEYASKLQLPAKLVKCLYDRDKQREHLEYCINMFLNLADKTKDNSDAAEIISKCNIDFCAHLILAAATFKHPSFGEEAEWRLVVRGEPGKHGRQFRRCGNILVPYLRVPIAELPSKPKFENIVIGPSQEQQLAKRSISALFEELDVHASSFSLAEAPYREWERT